MKKSEYDNQKQIVRVEGREITLSRREFQCLKLLAHGRRIKEIAMLLHISPRTVEDYITTSRNKINVSNSCSLINFYWGYIEPKIIMI